MPPKNKGKKKGGGGKAKQKSQKAAAPDEDDWDALLEASATVKKEETPAAVTDGSEEHKEEATPADAVSGQDAAAAFLAAQGLDTAGGDGEKKDQKKKKKKKKGAGGDKKDEKVSAKGKLIAERLARQKEEEDRILALEEAEKQRIADLEAAEEAERKQKEDEKERKKQKKQENIARQKAEGTYMTKAQKAKAALAQQRLEAMRKAGMLSEEADQAIENKKRPLYGNKKKGRKGKEPHQRNILEGEVEDVIEEVKPVVDEEKKPSAAMVVEESDKKTDENEDKESGGNWDDDSSGDEWDASSDEGSGNKVDKKFDDLAARLAKVTVKNDEDGVEDLVELEKKKDQERLRDLGLKRQEQERIDAENRAELMAEQEEANLKEQLKAQKREQGKQKRLEQEKANLAARSRDNLRCPIVVIMGHVDTGKTKLLDKIRKTNVQGGEAGGITQQIGATYFTKETLVTQTATLNETEQFDLTVPGMLVIDTPGHESFANLRSRGSSLCDVAILVVDLMHGLEQQTIESLNMLRSKKTPFVVALNKVDRCYAWKTCPDTPIRDALKEQPEGTVSEFRNRATEAKVQLQEQGVNSNIYWEMGDEDWMSSDFVPLVPTSAISGEGVQDILLLLCQIAQRKIWRQLMWHANLQCTVLEVKAIDGLGTTVDVLVVNGYLREGDKAVFCTLGGPVVTELRGLLTPPPSRELRVKSEYIHHKEVKGALGVKVIGNNLEKVMAGTPVMVVRADDEEEDIKSEVMSDLTKLQEKLSVDKRGVMVQASTLGALEALLQFLREDTKPPIPVSAVGIGTIHKRDVTKISVMNEKGCSEYATILAFDVQIEKEAREHATEMGVRIFTADIIYHLFDQFTRFMDELMEKRRQEAVE